MMMKVDWAATFSMPPSLETGWVSLITDDYDTDDDKWGDEEGGSRVRKLTRAQPGASYCKVLANRLCEDSYVLKEILQLSRARGEMSDTKVAENGRIFWWG